MIRNGVFIDFCNISIRLLPEVGKVSLLAVFIPFIRIDTMPSRALECETHPAYSRKKIDKCEIGIRCNISLVLLLKEMYHINFSLFRAYLNCTPKNGNACEMSRWIIKRIKPQHNKVHFMSVQETGYTSESQSYAA